MSTTWVPGTTSSGFGVSHLPYGAVAFPGGVGPAVRIGAHALDLRSCVRAGLLPADDGWAETSNIDGLLAAARPTWGRLRQAIGELLTAAHPADAVRTALHPLAGLPAPTMPFDVRDYVDFYSSLHHATNVGRLFRPDGDPLLPNWRHIPIGYHGRSGTVVVSGTSIPRPSGQRRPTSSGGQPRFGPTTQLDIELEVGFVTGGPATTMGRPIAVDQAEDHIFGVVLLNDWSARDIQAWEYQPLGPFLGKSFATSVGAWVTPLAALDAIRTRQPAQEPEPLPHLRATGDWALDLTLEVALRPAGTSTASTVSRVSFADMYWTMPQQLAHVTSNGATVRPGDLFASGTVSGAEPGTEGSLLERTHGGQQPFEVGGVARTFLIDGDSVLLRGHARGGDGELIRLAPVEGRIIPTP